MSRPIILGKQFGRTTSEGLIRFSPDALGTVNPHLIIAGTSGSGKSILIKSLIGDLVYDRKVVIVFDLHGDLETPGENLIEYTARNTRFGINPFEFDVDLKNGGPNVRVDVILGIFKKNFLPTMGTIQEAILRNLLKDAYILKGIHEGRPETWPFEDNEAYPENVGMTAAEAMELRGGKPESQLPTMQDLHDVYDKVMAFKNNTDQGGFFNSIQEAYRKKEKISNTTSENSKNKYREQLDSIRKGLDKEYEQFNEYLDSENGELPPIKDGSNIDFTKYESKSLQKSLETLGEYIKVFSGMNIFIKARPKMIHGVNRIDLSGFTNVAKPEFALFFVELSIQRIFRKCKIKGEYQKRTDKSRGDKVDTFVIADESRLILPNGREKDNPYNILNRVVLEARKYGLGLILASQRISHYNAEMLSNIYTKIILKTDESDTKETLAKLGLQGSDYMTTVNKNDGVGLVIRTGKRPDIIKMNCWENIVEGKEYQRHECAA